MIVELKMFETIFSFRKKNLINRISTNTTRDIKSLNLILGNPTKNRVQERKRELFNFATREKIMNEIEPSQNKFNGLEKVAGLEKRVARLGTGSCSANKQRSMLILRPRAVL